VAVGGLGVLLLGPPGAGKSSLALRLIDQPGYGTGERLMRGRPVADDQVVLRRQGGRLMASSPAVISGKMEVRGIGIAAVRKSRAVNVVLAVRLRDRRQIERLPEPSVQIDFLGVKLPLVEIDPRDAAAPARLRAALAGLVSAT
jgi:serine kinase of HPr protein (carbohydrate metabolism regulator)